MEIFFYVYIAIGLLYGSYLLFRRLSSSRNQEHLVGVLIISVPFWFVHLTSKLLDKKYRTI